MRFVLSTFVGNNRIPSRLLSFVLTSHTFIQSWKGLTPYPRQEYIGRNTPSFQVFPASSAMTEHTKDTTRVAAGLKAAIRNPNVSAEAKEHAKEKLKEMGQDMEPAQEPEPAPAHVHEESTRVLAGYKATLSNPYTSAEAKAHAEEVLQAAGIHERHPGHSDEEHQTRVLGGYKASLRNPHVSDEAKQHAREYLKEYGIEA